MLADKGGTNAYDPTLGFEKKLMNGFKLYEIRAFRVINPIAEEEIESNKEENSSFGDLGEVSRVATGWKDILDIIRGSSDVTSSSESLSMEEKLLNGEGDSINLDSFSEFNDNLNSTNSSTLYNFTSYFYAD